MRNLSLFFIFMVVLLTGCQPSHSISSIEGNIHLRMNNTLLVDCSDERTQGKVDSMYTTVYVCSLTVNEETKLVDSEGEFIRLEAFSNGDLIRINFIEPQRIGENNMEFIADEIVLLDD